MFARSLPSVYVLTQSLAGAVLYIGRFQHWSLATRCTQWPATV